MKEDTNKQPKKSGYGFGIVFFIMIAGVVIWIAYQAGAFESLLLLLPKKQLEKDLYWGPSTKKEVRVNFTWLKSKVKRENPRTNIDETQTFVKGTVYNLVAKPLEVHSIILVLKSADGITLHELSERTKLNIQAQQNESINFSGWVPTALLGDVKRLSGKLGYTLAGN